MNTLLAQMRRLLAYTKAIVALVGSLATYLLTVLPSDQYKWLGIVAALCTAIGTFALPNVPPVAPAAPPVGAQPEGAPVVQSPTPPNPPTPPNQ